MSRRPANRRVIPDDIDKRLLRHLIENGRATHSSLAQNVGLSLTACKARIRKMEKEGIIGGYTIRAGTGPAIGANRKYLLVELKSTGSKVRQEVEQYCASNPLIVSVELVEGHFDYLILIEEYNQQDHRKIVTDLGAMDGVQRTTTVAVLDRLLLAATIKPVI
jgi:Lrp/AsnC family transcriptional regulator, leucine-responsive regulatory protein